MKRTQQRTTTLLALASFAGFTLGCLDVAWAKGPINTNSKGVALEGYDPVAYFSESKPTPGKAEFSFRWQDVEWHFASKSNRDQFAKNPEKYAPRYGGYCAWAVSQGYTAQIDPKAWKIVGDRLYLNYNAKIQKKWDADRASLIKKADGNWPGIQKKLAQGK